jgi:hypothetical protein
MVATVARKGEHHFLQQHEPPDHNGVINEVTQQ